MLCKCLSKKYNTTIIFAINLKESYICVQGYVPVQVNSTETSLKINDTILKWSTTGLIEPHLEALHSGDYIGAGAVFPIQNASSLMYCEP